MAKRRRFTPEFKAELVFEVLSGVSSQAEVCRRHNLNENQLSEWKRHVLENASSLFESTDKQSSDAEKRIAHLEQLVGRMAVALDIQKKLLTELDSRYLKNDTTFLFLPFLTTSNHSRIFKIFSNNRDQGVLPSLFPLTWPRHYL